MVDWAVYTTSYQLNGNYTLDSNQEVMSGNVGRGSFYGTACGPNARWTHWSWGYNISNVLRTYGNTQRAGDVVITWLSPKQTMTAIGNGCSIYADPFAPGAVIFPAPYVTTQANGYYTFEWGIIPNSLLNQSIYSQAVVINPATQVIGWSAGRTTTFGNQAPTIRTAHRYNYSLSTTVFDPDKDLGIWGTIGTSAVYKVN